MRIARLLAAVLVVAAVGCGREGAITSVSAPGASQPPTATTTPSAAPTTVPASTAVPSAAPVATPARTTTPVAAAPLSEAALRKTLLTASELPGWSAGGPSGSSDDGSDFEPCGQSVQPKYGPTHEASAAYNQGQLGDQLELGNESHTSVAHAAASIKEARDQVKSCPTWSETEDDGTKVTFTAKEQSFPNIADETVAIRFEVVFSGDAGNGQSFEVHGDGLAVGARLGQNIVGVFHMALGINTHPELDTSETEAIARKAVAKFKRTA